MRKARRGRPPGREHWNQSGEWARAVRLGRPAVVPSSWGVSVLAKTVPDLYTESERFLRCEECPVSRKPPKTAVVAFKVEEELAEFLNKLPNKSAFIRKAIAAQLGMACPLCNGRGVVPRGIHDHYAGLIAQLNHRNCDG